MSTITPIIFPFANGRNDNISPALIPSDPDAIANQTTGFPVLQSLPLSTPNAIPVKEEEMNGVLNFYTNYLFQLGKGDIFTFNSLLSNKITGYSKGAILWYINPNFTSESSQNAMLQFSLHDNNTADFVTDPTKLGNGIDWWTITTPSITNNTIHALTSICPSINTSQTSSILQIPFVTGGANNGYMQTAITTYVPFNNLVLSRGRLYTDYSGNNNTPQPEFGGDYFIYTTPSKGGAFLNYIDETTQNPRAYWNLYDNYSSPNFGGASNSSPNSGIELKYNERPSITGIINDLSIYNNSISVMQDSIAIHYQTTDYDFIMKANKLPNGKWFVNFSGKGHSRPPTTHFVEFILHISALNGFYADYSSIGTASYIDLGSPELMQSFWSEIKPDAQDPTATILVATLVFDRNFTIAKDIVFNVSAVGSFIAPPI